MIAYEDYIIDVQNSINPILLDYVSAKECEVGKQVAEAMSYSLMVGGKRIRPALCIGTSKAVGGSTSDVVTIACAIEMIHTYSLIHDDLPAMDDDVLRRGKLTCHRRFDEATAILAGDALLTLAFEVLTEIGLNSVSLSPKILFKIMHKVSVAAGFKGMIGGQMMDVSSEGTILSQNQLRDMHILKTGKMIEAAVICGAIVARANDYQLEKLKKYAYNIGLSFQVTDDILNVIGDSAKLGKAIGTDSVRAKNTYPSIIGLKSSKQFAKQLINDALNALRTFDDRANPLRAIACYVLERNM